MKNRCRRILILVVAFAAVALALTPRINDAIQRAKQKQALEEMQGFAGARLQSSADQVGGAAAGATDELPPSSDRSPTEHQLSTLYASAAMFYIPKVPDEDPWGNPYEVTWGESASGADVLQIRCFGRDGKEGPTRPPYSTVAFAPTAYDEDIVWADGFFVRYPLGAQVD